jgi:adenylate kinase
MRIVLLGPPGSGKGTQAKFIVDEFGIPHISTGEIFRKLIDEETSIGLRAKELIDKGHLAPDDVAIHLVEQRLKQDDCKKGFLLDGFPRTVPQADALDKLLQSDGIFLDGVVNIVAPEDDLIERITGRRVCPSCGASFHIVLNPSKQENICDYCASLLVQRADDTVDTVKERLVVYRNQTEPLIEYYTKKNLLRNINGNQEINKVFKDICNVLRS